MDPLRGHPSSRLPAPSDVARLTPSSRAISRSADVGHVNLRVRDLERAVRFYRDVIGLHVTRREAESVFLAAGDYHHHLALNTWGGAGKPAPPDSAGLHHFAVRLPDARALAEVVVRIVRSGHEIPARPITASTSPFTYAIPTATASSSWSTGRPRNGHVAP